MAIWTIYNHGTNGSSLKDPDKAEIINLFGNNDRSILNGGKIITEGVGSIGDPHKLKNKYERDAHGNLSMESTRSESNTAVRLFSSATGYGVKDNVDSTVEFIRALNLAGQLPDAINMMGWSRGAVTCVRIAWTLYQSKDAALRGIPINIFAVDPVAGAGHSTEIDAGTITPNVRNYFATLAMDEKRRLFKPIAGDRLHVQDSTASDVWVVPMPGHHSDTAKNNNDVGRLVFNLAYRFLQGLGTNVPAMGHYKKSDAMAWKLYERLILGQGGVHATSKAKQFFLGGLGYKRSDEKSAHNFGEDFFPNVHARMLMLHVFPQTYRYYFGAGRSLGRTNPAALAAEQLSGGMAPDMVLRLERLPQVQNSGPGIPPHVLNMAIRLGLVG